MHIKIAWRALFVWLFLNVLLPRFCCQERATGHLDDDREGPQSWNAVELPSPSPAFTFLGETSTRYSTQASVNHPSVGVMNFSSMVSSNPIMRGFAMFDRDGSLSQTVSEAAESSTRSPTAFTDEDSGVTVSASPTSSISYVPSSLATSDLIPVTNASRVNSVDHITQHMETAKPTGKHFRRTAEEDAWGVFALAVSAISPVDDSGKDNFGEHYRVVNRTYFAQGLATSENEVEHELRPLRLDRMFEERNGTRLEGDLRESLPIYVLNRTAHLHSTLPEKKGDASSTKMTTSSNENGMEETTKLPSTVADSIFVPHFLPVNSILLLTDDNATKAVQEHGAGDFVSDVSETNSVSRTGSINEPPFSATVHTFENSPQMWESPSAFAGSTRSSVGGGQHAFTDSSFWLDNMRTIQPTSSMFSSQVSAADQRGSTMSVNTVSRSSFENRTPNPWEMQRNDTTLVATESAMIADPELSSELDPLHFDRIAVADSNTVGADQSFDWRARTISYNHEETDSQTFASTSVPAASYNSEREWATKMNTATIEPYSVITSHRKPSVQVEGTARFYRVRNNAVSNREDGLNEGYSTGSQAVASPHHAEDQFVSDEGLRSSNELLHGAGDGRSDVFSMEFEGDQFIAAQKYKDVDQLSGGTNSRLSQNAGEMHSSVSGSMPALVDDERSPSRSHGRFNSDLAVFDANVNENQQNRQEEGTELLDEYEYVYERSPNVEESGTLAKTVHSSDDLAMGLLLPSYPVFPYYPARQRGVSIAQSGRPLTAVEHVMLNGDLVERQRYLDGGRPVTVELWNRALHGHNLMIRPGSIIDGPLRRLQKEVINIGTGRNNIERERLKFLMEEMEKRDEAAHVAGVRNQMPSVSYKNDENVAQDGVEQSDPQYAEDVDGERPSPGGDLLASSDMSLMSERNLNECFIVSKNHVLMGASPFERRVAMTKAKCAQFCLSLDYCISASYSSSDFTCDAFNTKNGSGSARLFQINDYFYLEPKPGESAVCLAEANRTLPKLNGISLEYSRRHRALSFPSTEVIYTSFAVNNNDNTLPAYPPSTHFKGGCRSGEAVVFQQSVEWRLTRKTGQETEFVSTEEDCVFACSINLAKDSAPLECSSAVYDSWSRICTLSMLSAGQDRNDDLSSDPHAVYFEKTCLNDSLAALCARKRIERQPQHVLLGHAYTTASVTSLGACIQRCLASLDHGDSFQCRSAVYFHEEEVENCVLNRSTRVERPDDFAEEPVSPVDYVGLDECLATKRIPLLSEHVMQTSD